MTPFKSGTHPEFFSEREGGCRRGSRNCIGKGQSEDRHWTCFYLKDSNDYQKM